MENQNPGSEWNKNEAYIWVTKQFNQSIQRFLERGVIIEEIRDRSRYTINPRNNIIKSVDIGKTSRSSNHSRISKWNDKEGMDKD